MGKQSRAKRERRQHTTLQQHQRQGKTLVPPLAGVGPLKLSRWSDAMLPELLWAALLLTHGPRLNVIEMFRGIGAYFRDHESELMGHQVTLSGIERLPDSARNWLLQTITAPDPAREILSTLLLFDALPGKEHWERVLPMPSGESWRSLASTVGRTLSHQSQESTDAQWISVYVSLASGQLKVPSTMVEMVKEIFLYPHYGDQRKVRPTIRSIAKAFEGGPTPPDRTWGDAFWAACLRNTACFPMEELVQVKPAGAGTTVAQLRLVTDAVIRHASASRTTTAPDPKHDAVYGLALYSLALLDELLRVGNSSTLMARLALRTILEANVTLSYLAQKDDPDLWRSYRVFGAGQAKLISLKFRDDIATAPSSIEPDLVEQLANEDVWEEFLTIDLGHWEKSNLRSQATESGKKVEYDQFYAWTSMFTHAHWGAVRAAVFDTCGNPLHRLHRIPRHESRHLGDVLDDAVTLVDSLLDVVGQLYPGLNERLAAAAPEPREPA